MLLQELSKDNAVLMLGILDEAAKTTKEKAAAAETANEEAAGPATKKAKTSKKKPSKAVINKIKALLIHETKGEEESKAGYESDP